MTVIDLTLTAREPTECGDDEERIVIRRVDPDVVLTYCGAALASLSITWLVYERFTPFSGGLGFLAMFFACFVAITWLLAREQWGAVAARDHLVRVLITSAAIIALVPLLSIIVSVIARGYHALQLSFLTKTLHGAGSLDAFRAGGVWHSIVGTIEVVLLATLISVPLGIMTAVFLNEVRGPLARPVRMLTDAMSAIPSIVAGLFIFAVFISSGVLKQTGLAGALALSILMLPFVTRTAEVVLRLVPGGLREASLALGGSEWKTTSSVVLPTARTGLVTAVLLGLARVIGETAPLILTMGGAQNFNANPFSGHQDTLPLSIWSEVVNGSGSVSAMRMWSGAFVLMALVLILFVSARILASRGRHA
jgi:phosphate transport system permease protein